MSANIKASVGEGGTNRREDVSVVQTYLNANGAQPRLLVDGLIGWRTIAAIKSFQRRFFTPDGLIEPGKRTFAELVRGPSNSTRAAGSPGVARPTREPQSQYRWSGDARQWPEDQKYASMHPDLRPKVRAVMTGLTGRGFRPKIFFAWRSVAVQQEIYARGNSGVRFSFHNGQHPDGTPRSYAADIIDRRWAWNEEAADNGFWAALGEEAHAADLYWGGDWSSPDWAHVQLLPNSELARVRRESGQ